MKILTAIVCSLLATVALAQGWRAITVRDAGLSFSMPVLPQASQRTDQDGPYSVQTRIWVGSQATTNYVVSVSLLPANAPADFAKSMKEGIVKGFVNSTGSKIETDRQATYGKATGRQITFTTASGAKGALWIIERGKRIYSLTMARKTGKIDPDRTKFFNSLKLY